MVERRSERAPLVLRLFTVRLQAPLNVVKTKSLQIASNQKQKQFLESGEKLVLATRLRNIEAIPHIKYLGVHVDHTLNWKRQIQLI